MAKKSFFKKTNTYPAEEISDSNHPQRISCNKKANQSAEQEEEISSKENLWFPSNLFAPGSSSKVLITSADSQIQVVDDIDLVHKFKENYQNSLCNEHVLVKTKLLTIGGH
ncbi:hypothetical protein RGQ29_030691 [Quercus rubra]|uniref:Uncharacterized protein n=1 Tax=Quercus rubra TaxID=3512 RepID=A0AAN7EI65_QUERU|nr:hypothetical protein RGQ29_030691 [Quercus rubra]